MKQQRGVALIVVLMILALMTLLAAQMSERLQFNFYRVENQLQNQQAYWYAQGMEALAKVAIDQSLSDSDTVNLSQVWATRGQRYPLEGGEAVGNIFDRQACFNLNALSELPLPDDRSQKPFLVRYLQSVLEESGIDSYDAEVIADSSWEYVDPAEAVNAPFGAGDSTYEGFQPAYLPPMGMMADVSEFRAVNGVSARIYQKVRTLLCAIPSRDLVLNVNTIAEDQAALLVGLFAPELPKSDATTLIGNRPYDGWQTVDAFMGESTISRLSSDVQKRAREHLAVSSNYFQLDTEIRVDRSRVRLVALIKREGQDKVTVVRRRYGGISERVSDDKAQ
ncbi:type II secretion system minor pseudopilin GspK [Photobacterium atrarenae]|uniref:Type II secretion system protein K n=1 Tax=Photobacterium atrarenae TaxID=865757 RepID=A0ABY5GEV1_9GAMM|nr:type II secretion system minor pseudopilin GspK [Photobacterium atrarenae]UTV27629.1 type II secretion system minor pseudopilin GspK [Photobacterium atrarenae]